MKIPTLVILFSASAMTLLAADPWIGRWKMNPARSTFVNYPAPQAYDLEFQQVDTQIRQDSSIVDSNGVPLAPSTTTFAIDGTERPSDDPNSTTRITRTRLNPAMFCVTARQNGQVTSDTFYEVLQDSNTLRYSVNTTVGGKPSTAVIIFERQ